MKYVVMFSGGIASYSAAKRTIAAHGKENTILYKISRELAENHF